MGEGRQLHYFVQRGELITLKLTLKWIMVLVVGLLTAQVSAEEPPLLKTENDKLSYATGVDIAKKNVKQQGISADVDLMTKGLKDALSGAKFAVTEADLRVAMTAFRVELGWTEAHGKTPPANVSYGLGVEAARSLQWYGFTFDADLVARGLKDMLSGKKLAMTEEDLLAAMAPFQGKMRQTRMTAVRLTPEDSASPSEMSRACGRSYRRSRRSSRASPSASTRSSLLWSPSGSSPPTLSCSGCCFDPGLWYYSRMEKETRV